MSLPTLRTRRLLLRPWDLDDTDALHALWTEPEVRRYLWDDVVISREQAQQTVRDMLDSSAREGIGGWVALDAQTGALAGFVGLIRREPGDPELLYGLAPAWWGRGLATEAARAVLAYAFGPLACDRVTAATDAPNTDSVRVMERLGMRFTHRGLLNGLDSVFYEVRRDEFTRAADTARR